MAPQRDKYYTELFRTIIDCTDHNGEQLSNENIQYAIHKVIAEEEADAHNVTVDTFSQTPNTQRENENTILTSEKRDKSDARAETLKWLTINDVGYYESDSVNGNGAKDNPASNPKVYTHTTDGKKRKVTDTSNGYLQQKLLSKRTLLIITTTIDPQIGNKVATSGLSPHKLAPPQKTEVITDEARTSAQILQTPRHVRRTVRDGTMPRD